MTSRLTAREAAMLEQLVHWALECDGWHQGSQRWRGIINSALLPNFREGEDLLRKLESAQEDDEE